MADARNFLVRNRSNRDLFVTIYDLNSSSGSAVWDGERLNEDSEQEISLLIDGSDEAKVKWVAVLADDPDEMETLTDLRVDLGDPIDVYVR